jgi:hypothetical protein
MKILRFETQARDLPRVQPAGLVPDVVPGPRAAYAKALPMPEAA